MTSSEPLTRADVLTAAEASRLLGIPRSTLYALARRHESNPALHAASTTT